MIILWGPSTEPHVGAKTLLPKLGIRFGPNQRILRAGQHWYIGSADQFKHAKGVRQLLFQPHISGNDRDPEDLRLRRLDQQEHRLLVTACWTGGILINNDLALLLGHTSQAQEQKRNHERPSSINFHQISKRAGL